MFSELRARSSTLSRKENAAQQEYTKAAQDFIEKYRVKAGFGYDPLTRKVKVHVKNGGIPENSIKVRDLERDGVDLLIDSFLNTGIKLPMDIIGVIWADPNSKLLSTENLGVDFTVPVTRYFIHFITGLHRMTAMAECHKMFQKKALYSSIDLVLLIVPKTHLNKQTLLYIGNSDNRKTQAVVKTSQWSVVKQFRRQLEEIQSDTTLSASEVQTAFTHYKEQSAPEIPFLKNTLHTFSAAASVDKAVFDLMEKIFNGEFVINKNLKGQKKPDAVTHFTSMSGIPPKKLCQWLTRVLEGDWLTSTFQKRCKIYTKTERVFGQILEYIVAKKPRAGFHSMADVTKVYPACGDGSWYEAVINSCEDAVKAKLSIHAIKMIDDMMETKDALDQEKKVCITFECCFVRLFILIFLMSQSLTKFCVCSGC